MIHGLLNLESTNFFQILPVTHETRSHSLQIQKQVYRCNSLIIHFQIEQSTAGTAFQENLPMSLILKCSNDCWIWQIHPFLARI